MTPLTGIVTRVGVGVGLAAWGKAQLIETSEKNRTIIQIGFFVFMISLLIFLHLLIESNLRTWIK
jgi:hypothetical protein